MRKKGYKTPSVQKTFSVFLEGNFLTGTQLEVQASGQKVEDYDFESASFNHTWVPGTIDSGSGN